jgi:hypothetical protein
MLHKIEAPSSGESMLLDYSDWYHLLHLAARYGWRVQEDLNHYTTEERAISAYEAEQMSAALKRAERDLTNDNTRRRAGPRLRLLGCLDRGRAELLSDGVLGSSLTLTTPFGPP